MITFRFTGTDGTMVETETLTSGMVKKKVKLEFSNDWDNRSKMVVFTAGSVSRDVVCVSDVVEIPAEVLAKPLQQLYVGAYGVSDDGEVTPTICVMGPKIAPGVDPSGDQSTTQSLPVWAQLQAMIGDLDNLDTEAKENLVAAINEAAKTGNDNGNADLTGYATEQWVQDGYQPKGNYLTEHQDISGKLDASKLPEAVNDALGQAKASGEFDGKSGEDGYSPSATVNQTETGAVITITDKSGTTTATVTNGKDGADGKPGLVWKGQYSINDAYFVNDVVACEGSCYVAIADSGGDNPSESPSDESNTSWSLLAAKGTDGASVTVKSVSESTADGGSNVVTFSDGRTLTVKNGSKGDAGASGKTPVKGTDYFTAEDKSEMVNAVIATLPVYAGEVI